MSYLKELARNFQCSQEVQPPQADPSLTASTALTVRPNHPTGLERKIAGWSDADKIRIQRELCKPQEESCHSSKTVYTHHKVIYYTRISMVYIRRTVAN